MQSHYSLIKYIGALNLHFNGHINFTRSASTTTSSTAFHSPSSTHHPSLARVASSAVLVLNEWVWCYARHFFSCTWYREMVPICRKQKCATRKAFKYFTIAHKVQIHCLSPELRLPRTRDPFTAIHHKKRDSLYLSLHIR